MKIIFKIIMLFILIVLIINLFMIIYTNKKIKDQNKLLDESYDCILVLGAGIRNGKPSPMLEDRLLMAKELYTAGLSSKILVSGDHMNNNYDEVNVMKDYLIEAGVPSEAIFMDHAGISTYDSVYRAKKIFEANKILLVTQKYHLYRALYIAKTFNMDAIGISADRQIYYGQLSRDIREIAARVKDFIKCIYKPTSKYLGEVISIKGNGDQTNDN